MKEITKGILRYQLDLEILLRLQEKKLIELEVLRGTQIKETLELAIINDHKNQTLSEAKPIPTMKRQERIASDNTPSKSSQHQYEIRPDGSAVKLRCPVCYSDRFKSMLGYLNHCRIHCKVIFSSPEDRQTRGGVPVDIDQVPYEIFIAKHPSLVKQEHDLAMIRSEVSNNSYDESRLPNINDHDIEYPVVGADRNNTIETTEVADSKRSGSSFY